MNDAVVTSDQPNNTACRHCGTTVPPLHPDETIDVPHAVEGLVREVVVSVVCTQHLALSQ